MQSDFHRHPLDDCPNCGAKEGAYMGSTSWRHDYLCCSDECGLAFATSPKRYRLEIHKIQEQIEDLEERRRHWRDKLREAASKAPTDKALADCPTCRKPIQWEKMSGIRVHVNGVYQTKCDCGIVPRDASGRRFVFKAKRKAERRAKNK